MVASNQKIEKVTIFCGLETGYSAKGILMPFAGLYKVSPSQKAYLLGTFPEWFFEPDSEQAKNWLAEQKSRQAKQVKSSVKEYKNPPPWPETPEAKTETGKESETDKVETDKPGE